MAKVLNPYGDGKAEEGNEMKRSVMKNVMME